MAFINQFVSEQSVPGLFLVAIAIAAILVYVPFGVVGYGRLVVGYDSTQPRALFDKLPPYAQRATWAHENGFESLAFFAPAALMAYVTGQSSTVALGAAIAYLIARLLYPLFYILNIPTLRSLMFGVANIGVFTLFFLSCRTALF
ncbi:MAG: MAPEG family protein [Cyanobacteria bacterium P01_A01_bin.123]